MKWAKNEQYSFLGGGPFEQGTLHGLFHPRRQNSGCAAAESGLFKAEIPSVSTIENPFRASTVGLCRSGMDLFQTAEL